MDNQKVFAMSFSKIYPLYVQKAERKSRTKKEVDEIICWLTGYDPETLQAQIDRNVSLQTFFEEAPQMNPNAALIKGVVCGVRVEEIDDRSETVLKELTILTCRWRAASTLQAPK